MAAIVNVTYEMGGRSFKVIGTIRRATAIETPKIRWTKDPVVTNAARTPPTMVIVMPILKGRRRSVEAVIDHFPRGNDIKFPTSSQIKQPYKGSLLAGRLPMWKRSKIAVRI